MAKGVSAMKSPDPERLNQPSIRLLGGDSEGTLCAGPGSTVPSSTEGAEPCVGGAAICAQAEVVPTSNKKNNADIKVFAG